ncbi:S-acyltransferase [Melia azedarach]|uniref:S-acyltransferase n=1 Tax=Melia azedarach TaxID=155640 RepID=A0ACC1YBB1_MELAZ|nr:S-acyltransferase [Melia azedarach]
MSMDCQRFLSIPILAVILLLGFVYYATVFIFINDWVGLQTSAGFLNALIFTSLVCLFLFSFSIAVLTDPGHVPSSFIPDVEDTVSSDQELQKTSSQVSQCDKCSAYKPPRTHHCKVCRRCVLRMDHHCLWINNCVGHWNYKAFFLLVLFGTTGSIYSTVMLISSGFHKDWDFGERVPLKIFYVCCGAMMVLLSLTLGTLLGWHVYLIIHNMTTIEYYEGIRAAWLARKSGQSYRHPFDVGVYKNITLVLGPNMLTWLCPTAVSHLKDGTSFPSLRHSS